MELLFKVLLAWINISLCSGFYGQRMNCASYLVHDLRLLEKFSDHSLGEDWFNPPQINYRLKLRI